jgi:SAM-dependent methyltransferase
MNEPLCIISKKPAVFILKKDGYSFYCCRDCGLVFVHPIPEAGAIKGLYSKESGYQANKEDISRCVQSTKKDRTIIAYLKSNFLGGKVLDVGASSGDFLFLAKEAGLETYGVEINERTGSVAQARGLNVFIGSFEEAPLVAKSFNAIFLGDVIEHMPDLRILLEKCKDLLVPGGSLIISTPNLDSFWARSTWFLYKHFGIPWSVLTPPHHLYQFREDNLDLFLLSYGFHKKKSWFFRPPRLMYELGSLHLWKSVKEKKSLGALSFCIFAFLSYIFIYTLDLMLTPLKRKDFAMVSVYNL